METSRKFKEPVVLISTPARFDASVFRAVAARKATATVATVASAARVSRAPGSVRGG